MSLRKIARDIAYEFCDESAGERRLARRIERALIDERQRCARIALVVNRKHGNGKEICLAIRAQPA